MARFLKKIDECSLEPAHAANDAHHAQDAQDTRDAQHGDDADEVEPAAALDEVGSVVGRDP